MYVISLYPILVLAAIVKDWDVALFFPAVQPGSTFPLQVLSIFRRCLYSILQRNIINTRSTHNRSSDVILRLNEPLSLLKEELLSFHSVFSHLPPSLTFCGFSISFLHLIFPRPGNPNILRFSNYYPMFSLFTFCGFSSSQSPEIT